MATHVDSDITVQRFGFTADAKGKKLEFPRATLSAIEGRTGDTTYGAADCIFDKLEGRLDTTRWTADAASLGSAYLRDDANRFDLAVERLELPSGIRLTRADKGIELLSPHASLTEMKLLVRGPFARRAAEPAPSAASSSGNIPVMSAAASSPALPATPAQLHAELRQRRLRFLDSLSGKINFTVKVELELPVLGTRRLDQGLKLPITEGQIDYRALDDSLDWLEGQFVDIDASRERLAVRWKVPIFGASHDLISWALDEEAATLSSFGKVPVRSLFDFRIGSGKPDARDRKRKIVQALSLDAIDIALSLLAPRSVETSSGGTIMFGGDDEPGLVDLKMTGSIRDVGPGVLRGAIGSIDTTIRDARIGPATITADRLHFDGLESFEVKFDAFAPTQLSATVHRVTATNLRVKLGA